MKNIIIFQCFLLSVPFPITFALICEVKTPYLGTFLKVDKAESYNDCLFMCKENEKCKCFTFYQTENACMQIKDCSSLDLENTRTPSISGEAQCMPQEKCSYDKKSCIGKTHKFGGKVNSIEDCKNQCKIHTDCTWVNYDRSTSFCTLLKNCMDMKVCAECVTANGKDCSISKNAVEKMNTLLVGTKGTDLEFINLSNPTSNCSTLPEVPIKPNHQVFGTFVGDKIMICYEQCAVFDNSTWTWRKIHSPSFEHPFYMTGVNLDDNHWWMAGGFKRKTKLFNARFRIYQDFYTLPKPHYSMRFEKFVKINDSSIFILLSSYTNQTYFFNPSTQELTEAPPLSDKRLNSVAGMITDKQGGKFIVVAGGSHTIGSEILDLKNPVEWKTGPELPSSRSHAGTVQYEDSFLIIGGYDHDYKRLDTILKYDVSKGQFDILPWKLSKQMAKPLTFLVPDNYCMKLLL